MFSYIEKLRKEPLEKRRQFAIVATTVVVGVIIVLWILYLFLTGVIFNTDTARDSSEREVVGGIERPY